MTWSLKGQLIESCSCNMFCPCWFGVQELMVMDQGWCDSVIGFRVREGSSDGLTLDGREVVLGFHFPGPTMFDGNATARLFVEEGADDDQQRELEAIFQGKKGGPMAVLDSLVATWLPTKSARVDVGEEGDSITMATEGAGELRSQLLRDPEGTPFTLRGGGFVSLFGMEMTELAPTATRWADPELPHSFETKSGARGDFAWSG